MVQEAYCSYEVSKLLKERGFNEWCNRCYGISVRHNGVEIDEDEEYELKSAGRENEIEYIDGGHLYIMNSNNIEFEGVYACPTHQFAMAWLREKGIYVEIRRSRNTFLYGFLIFDYKMDLTTASTRNKGSYEEAVEAALKYVLENLMKTLLMH